MKLTVVSVEEEKKIGTQGAVKLQFKAKDGDKTLTYFTFSKRLFPAIVEGKEIDATVEVSEREYDGNTYTDRKVTDIEGVAKGGFQGGGRQEDPVARASIEAGVAVKAVTDLLCADKKVPADINKAYESWLRDKLKAQATTETPLDAPESSQDTSIDLDWLKASLVELQWTDVVAYLKERYKITGTSVTTMTPKLNEMQKAEFIQEVKSRLGIPAEDIPF